MAVVPDSYKDPFWIEQAAKAEKENNIPSGLLRTIMLHGEKSNNSQVSEANAKTPFQIIPATRNAVLKKYGVDAYLSPENAAKTAALLLKEGLDRNQGDEAAAVGEYHGGTNRDNWGERTNAYIARVTANRIKDKPSNILPDSVLKAYSDKIMKPEERAQLERDVKSGLVSVPEGFALEETTVPGIVGQALEMVTGSERRTPETEAAPDWTAMPEFESDAWASLKTALGTAMTDGEETAKILKANFPDINVRQDQKGNYFFKSAIDGAEYAYKPGFRMSDIPRAGAAAAMFLPAGRATGIAGGAAAGAASQAGVEATQAATGGDFDVDQVALAGAMGGAAPVVGKVVGDAAKATKDMAANVLGKGKPKNAATNVLTDAAQNAETPAPSVAPAPEAETPQPITGTITADDLITNEEFANKARRASVGGLGETEARRVLATEARPDAETLEAAKLLGIENHLQPDHITTSQRYRELAQAAKSIPGSAARSEEIQGLQEVAKRADDLITEIGGTSDLSDISARVRSTMDATQEALDKQANELYEQIREGLPGGYRTPPQATDNLIKESAELLGSPDNISDIEKRISAAFNNARDRQGHVPYALLDNMRKKVGDALGKKGGEFKDGDRYALGRLYQALGDDQATAAAANGLDNIWQTAKATVQTRKALEDDMAALFGKKLDQTIASGTLGIPNAIKKLPAGEVAPFLNLLKSVPANMRGEVVSSGFAAAYGASAKRADFSAAHYAKWFEGLKQNKQAYAAVMTHLEPEARKKVTALYKVADGIRKATREHIATGRLNAVKDSLTPPDTFIGRLYDEAKTRVAAAPLEALTTASGAPGAGFAMSHMVNSAVRGGKKPDILEQLDKFITSEAFLKAIADITAGNNEKAASSLARTPEFGRYMKALSGPRELKKKEQWILNMLQVSKGDDEE